MTNRQFEAPVCIQEQGNGVGKETEGENRRSGARRPVGEPEGQLELRDAQSKCEAPAVAGAIREVGFNQSCEARGRCGPAQAGSDHTAGVLQPAQLLDLDGDRVAVLHPDLRVAAETDAVRRAGENDVARLEREGG